ncbi:hypothetical protein JCM15519_19030 [Fundidesulfovibrio butyratiphilus]
MRLLASQRPDHAEEGRQAVLSRFLVGVGFAPFVLAVVQLGLMIVFAGFHPLFLAWWHTALAGGACLALRGTLADLGRAWREFWAGGRENRGATLLAGAVALFVAGFCLLAAAKPLWHGDTLIYAVETKAMRDARSYTARLEPTPKPDANNYLRLHGHPIAYNGLMAAGWTFSPDRQQDLPMRLALQTQNLVLVLVLLGLGLRFGPLPAVLAVLVLLFEQYFGALIDMSSRESYRLIPLLMILGLLPGRRRSMRLASGRGGLTFAAWTYLWSAHTGSIMVAPVLAVCLVPALRGRGALRTTLLCCAFGFLLGANQILLGVVRTGNPLAFEDNHFVYELIAPRKTWDPPLRPAPGMELLPERFLNQARGDGWVCTLSVFASLLAAAALARRRRPLPAPVLAAALFVLVNEMQVLGMLDWIKNTISDHLYSVPRYRLALYPPAALVLAYGLSRIASPRPDRARTALRLWASGGLVACAMLSACLTWERSPLDLTVVRGPDILARLDPMKSCWSTTLRLIKEDASGRPPVIFTDSPVIAWYYTDLPVHSLYSERLRVACLTHDPAKALAELDALGVTHVQLNKVNILSGTALGAVMASPAFAQVGDCIYDRVYARVPGS